MSFSILVRLLSLVALGKFAVGSYSIHYQGAPLAQEHESKIMNFGSVFAAPPSAEQVADIYTRLSGNAPLLWEDQVNLPAVHSFKSSEPLQRPVLVEVRGGVLPESATPVIKSAGNSKGVAPSMQEVSTVLGRYGVKPVTKVLQGDKEVESFLQNLNGPAVILHHESEVFPHVVQRVLTSSTNTTVPLSEFQISQYQICLWAGVIFVALISTAICAVVNMEVIPDNILYAKFQSGRIDGKRD